MSQEGYSTFILVWVCQKYGLRERTAAKFGGHKELIFLSNLRLLELEFDQILGLRTEFLSDYEMGILGNGQEGMKRGS